MLGAVLSPPHPQSRPLAPFKTRVLILAEGDRLAGPLSAGLDRLDWPTVTARGVQAALTALQDLAIEAVVIDAEATAFDAEGAAARLKAAYAPRRLPVLALGAGQTAGSSLDLALAAPVHPSQVAARLEVLVRSAVADEEFELRAETFAARGRTLSAPETRAGPLRVLTVGEPAPKFLALSHALRAGGAETIGAFTAYTAFDYLHERPFEAVVLWAGEVHAEAISIAAGMRRNTRLFHIPTVLYLRPGVEVQPADTFSRGLSDIASADVPEAETARRVLALAQSYRREQSIRLALEKARSSGLMDAATGLFTRDLFAAHLVRLERAMRARGRPLSLAVLRVGETAATPALRAGGWLDRATPQIGSMLGRLVRAEDTAARLAPDLFALALPGAAEGAALIAAERIAAVIGCTAFDAGEDRAPFTVAFDIGVGQLTAGETAAHVLERAAIGAVRREAV